jgi:NADPH:quinone reductase
MEEDDPRPDPGEVCVRVLAAGVSISDAQMRAGPSSSTTPTSS